MGRKPGLVAPANGALCARTVAGVAASNASPPARAARRQDPLTAIRTMALGMASFRASTGRKQDRPLEAADAHARRAAMTEAIDLLKKRRSPRIPDLAEPAPSDSEVETLLTVASRVPDHGKLTPWRFLVLRKEGRAPLAEALSALLQGRSPRGNIGSDRKGAGAFRQFPADHRCDLACGTAREDSGMGTDPVRGSGVHESRDSGARARLRR